MAVQAKFTIVTDASQVNTGLRQVNAGLDQTAKKAESTSTSMAKGFIKAELAMKAVRLAVKFAVDGLKEFEKETGKTQGLTETTKLIKNLQIQVADMLAPALQDLASQSNDNFDSIAKSVRTATAVFINFFGAVKIGVDVLILGVALLGVTWTASIIGIINVTQALVDLMAKIPGPQRKIFEAISKGQDEMADKLRGIRDGLFDVGNQARDEIQRTANDMANTELRIGEVSTVRTGGADAKKAAEDEAKNKRKIQHEQYYLQMADKAKYQSVMSEMDSSWYDRNYEMLKSRTDREFTYLDVTNAERMEMMNGYKEAMLNAITLRNMAESDAATKSHEAAMAEQIAANKGTTDIDIKFMTESGARNEKMRADRVSVLVYYESKLNELYKGYLDERAKITQDMSTMHTEVLKVSYKGQLKLVNEYETAMSDAYGKALDDRLIDEEEYAVASSELTLYVEQQRTQIIMDEVQKQTALYAGMAQTTAQIFTNLASYNINQIERQRKAEIKAVEGSVGSSKEKAERIDEINKEMDKKIREQKKKQQAWAIASALIAGAVASMNMWQGAMTLGPIAGPIVGGIQQALLVALTASEVALIASQEFARGGIVQGNPAAGDVQSAKLTAGEVVLNKEQQARTLMAIANGGGRGSNAPSIRGGDIYVTIEGNADEAILEEALRRSRQNQQHDMKQLLRQMQYSGNLRVVIA